VRVCAGEGDTEMAAPPEEQAAADAAAAATIGGEDVQKTDGTKTPTEGDTAKTAAQAAADLAVAKLRTQLEAVQKSERDASSSAAESLQRAVLGKRLHEIEVNNAIRDEPVGMDRRHAPLSVISSPCLPVARRYVINVTCMFHTCMHACMLACMRCSVTSLQQHLHVT
jgi:hypothetical protein